MTDTPPRLAELEKRRREVRELLANIGEMRPGSLVGRYRKCGKPGCHCARPLRAGAWPQLVTHPPSRGQDRDQGNPPRPRRRAHQSAD